MFKKKDLAIAITMALSVSPASFAQTPMDESVEQTPETGSKGGTKAGVEADTEAGTIAGVPAATAIAAGIVGGLLFNIVVDDNNSSPTPTPTPYAYAYANYRNHGYDPHYGDDWDDWDYEHELYLRNVISSTRIEITPKLIL